MSVSKSSLQVVVSYDFGAEEGGDDIKQLRDSGRLVALL